MPMRMRPAVTSAPTFEALLCGDRGGGSRPGRDKVLDRFPAAVVLLPVYRQIGSSAHDGFVRCFVRHLQRVMAAARSQVAGTGDEDAIRSEGEREVGVARQ